MRIPTLQPASATAPASLPQPAEDPAPEPDPAPDPDAIVRAAGATAYYEEQS